MGGRLLRHDAPPFVIRDPEASDPRLGALELRFADAVAVTDAHLLAGQSVDGEVLAEVPVGEIVASEIFLPVPVRLDLVDENRPPLGDWTTQTALAVPRRR